MKTRTKCIGCGGPAIVNFEAGRHLCSCGYLMLSPTEGYWRDGRDVPPSILERGASYIVAWARWVRAGRPLRSERDSLRNLQTCLQCPGGYYEDGGCLLCGCAIKEGGTILGDKTAWATESCPKNYWPTDKETADA